MVTQIHGQAAEDNDNNPVEVRHYQIEGSTLDDALGNIPTSRIYYELRASQPLHYWQYFPNGIIVWSRNTCAQVLYGSIFEYWAQTGQFEGPLGSPATDIMHLPDGTSFAVFENGVLWADFWHRVSELSPVTPDLVKNFAQVDTSADGIAALAQQKINDVANNEIQTNQKLKDNVNSISASVEFDSVGGGGCEGAGFNSVGVSLIRSHIFRVHLDFDLKGCSGTIGSASAAMHVTIRLRVSPPNIQAFLADYSIDSVASPYSVGDSDIRSGLATAFNKEYGKDLLGKTLPKGISILAAIVDTAGNVSLYMEPLCTPTNLMRFSRQTLVRVDVTLNQIRRLRDDHLLRKRSGPEFVRMVDICGPILLEAIREQPDAARLRESISHFLVSTFHERADLAKVSREITPPATRMLKLITAAARKSDPELIDSLAARAVTFIRKHLAKAEDADFQKVMMSLARDLDEEIKHIERREEYAGTLAKPRPGPHRQHPGQ